MKEKLKNKDIIMEIILHSSGSNGYTEITNKKIAEIAEKNYNKKLYDSSITNSLKELEEIGYIRRNTIINGNIKKRTIYITKTERKKNIEIIMEIIRNNSVNNYTTISNKEIIEIAANEYNKKLYNKTIAEALIQLEILGCINRHTITNGAISHRTIYITNNTPSIEQKNKVLNIINSLKRDQCLTTDEVVAKYCEDLVSDANIQFIVSLENKTKEEITKKIYNQNKKTIQTILQELTKNKKIIEHRAVKKLGRNVPKKIKDKVQNLPTNTRYYISKSKKIVEEEEEIKEYYL